MSEIARTARVRRVPFGLPSAVASDDEDAATTDGVGRTPIKLGDVVGRQPTTFYVRMASDALLDSGIHAGDVLVVDRTLRPHYGALAVVTLGDGDGLHEQGSLAGMAMPLIRWMGRCWCGTTVLIARPFICCRRIRTWRRSAWRWARMAG